MDGQLVTVHVLCAAGNSHILAALMRLFIAQLSSHLYVPHILPNNIIEFLVYKCKIVHWEFGAACPFMFPKVAAVAEFYRPSFPSS